MDDRAERMEEALHHILNWCEAYPEDVFVQPDLEEVRKILGDSRMSALHGAWARHLLSGISRYARGGLSKESTEAFW